MKHAGRGARQNIMKNESTVRHESGAVSDELLVKKAQQGDSEAEEYIIRKYKEMVRSKARRYFIVGADNEDTVQEGMIGIFKAIRGYDGSKNASFHTFAELCINRQIITAIKTAQRQKHSPLNNSVSFNGPVDSEKGAATLEEILEADGCSDPEMLYILKEDMNFLEKKVSFSDMEMKVYSEYRKGRNYNEIAQMIGKTPKSVDNTIQRTKKKLYEYFGIIK